MKLSVLAISLISLTLAPTASAQCGDVILVVASGLSRTGGNTVAGYSSAYVISDDPWTWYIEGTAQVAMGGSIRGFNSVGSNAIVYSGFQFSLQYEMEGISSGTFGMDESYNFSQSCWGGPFPFSSSDLQYDVYRPTVSGADRIWWFNGQQPSGFPTNTSLVANLNCGSCTDTPEWVASANGDKVLFSCTECSSPTIYSDYRSDTPGDIPIHFSIDGFESTILEFTVNAPLLLAAKPPYTAHEIYFDGYESLIRYSVLDIFLSEISNVPVNETFATFWNDHPTNNWAKPPAGGYTLSGNEFNDHIFVYCNGCIPTLAPPVQNPQYPLGTTKIDHTTQNWFVGSIVSGQGVGVQTNGFQRYQDHGNHE